MSAAGALIEMAAECGGTAYWTQTDPDLFLGLV
jgi:hypothetical protein